MESYGLKEILAIKSHQIHWNLLGIHEILAIKSRQIQWNLVGSMKFQQSNLIKFNGNCWDPMDFSNQIPSDPLESYGIHEVLAIKSHQIEWNLKGSMNPMGSMRFQHSNLIKSNGILWSPCDFSNQISSNLMESNGIHEIFTIKPHQIQWNPMGSMLF